MGCITHSLLPPLHCNLDVWVNASMSWGIGLVVTGCWAAWWLLDGWKEAGHDIGWVEMVALELALLWMVSTGIQDAKVIVHGDNTGMQGVLKKG